MIEHSGKGKTRKAVKRSVVVKRSWGGRDDWVGPGIFRAVKLFHMMLQG